MLLFILSNTNSFYSNNTIDNRKVNIDTQYSHIQTRTKTSIRYAKDNDREKERYREGG